MYLIDANFQTCLKGRGGTDSPNTPGRKKGSGRGRKKATHSFEPTPGDPDKPFACEREFISKFFIIQIGTFFHLAP